MLPHRLLLETLSTPAQVFTAIRDMWVRGAPQDGPSTPGSDVAINLDGYISVTPMRADLTCHASLGALREALEG